MPAFYLDTSALAKRYIQETGSAWIRSITDPSAGNICWLSSAARVEMVAALYRRARMGDLTNLQAQSLATLFQHDLQTHFHLLSIDENVLNRAAEIAAIHPLRAYDAIQLATASQLHAIHQQLSIQGPTVLMSDAQLLQAALAEGLHAEDPAMHP